MHCEELSLFSAHALRAAPYLVPHPPRLVIKALNAGLFIIAEQLSKDFA